MASSEALESIQNNKRKDNDLKAIFIMIQIINIDKLYYIYTYKSF